MDLIINLLVSGLAVFIVANILPGVSLDNFVTAIIVAVVMGIVNAIVKPIISILALPVTILTFGLFSFVVNALMVLLVDALVAGFSVANFGWALLFSLILSIVSSFLRSLKQ